MGRWYGPQEQWPRHSKPWWRERLEHARSAGWSLRELDGHAWGRLVCDPTADEPCKIIIFSTGDGGESAARDARKDIDHCVHLAGEVDEQALVQAAVLLDQAERLLEAAQRCLEAADKAAEMEDLLAGAAFATAAAEALLEQALKADAEGDELLVEAFRILPPGNQMGYPPRPGEVETLIVTAGGRADQAQRLVEGLPHAQPVDLLRSRIERVRARRDELLEHVRRSGNAGDRISL